MNPTQLTPEQLPMLELQLLIYRKLLLVANRELDALLADERPPEDFGFPVKLLDIAVKFTGEVGIGNSMALGPSPTEQKSRLDREFEAAMEKIYGPDAPPDPPLIGEGPA